MQSQVIAELLLHNLNVSYDDDGNQDFSNMNFSTFFSIFPKLCYKHFVMGMKSVNSWNKSHIFCFWLPYPHSPVVRTPTDWRNSFGTVIDKNHVYSFYILLHFSKRIFCLQNQENCSFGNGIYYSRFQQDAFPEKNFKKGVKLDSSSLPPPPLSFTFKMKWL